jgi:hypothetical protein
MLCGHEATADRTLDERRAPDIAEAGTLLERQARGPTGMAWHWLRTLVGGRMDLLTPV